jgi:hypothetical protein
MRLGSLAVSLLCSACSTHTTAHATLTRPASIPIRAFTRALVGGGHLDHELAVVEAVVTHLEGGGLDASRVEVDQLETLRQRRQIAPGTAVILVGLTLEERSRTEMGTRPETLCGRLGCTTVEHPSVLYEIPVTRARVRLTIYDGPSARVMQR